ncbi:MAG: PEP-CTERM sorting domain-containing protein [Nitrospiria bacterium]
MENGSIRLSFSKHVLAFGLLTLIAIFAREASAIPIFINEIHYDNAGADTGEAVEIAAPAGSDLAGWSLVLYNGSNGLSYRTTALTGIIADQQAGFGTRSFGILGIQNGAPDGLALIDPSSSVIQFLSYEGVLTANNGPAAGMSSTDIGVFESGSTPVGHSLQLAGNGNTYGDFSWESPNLNTFGNVNTRQSFVAPAAVPEPPALFLLGTGLTIVVFLFKKRTSTLRRS